MKENYLIEANNQLSNDNAKLRDLIKILLSGIEAISHFDTSGISDEVLKEFERVQKSDEFD